MRNFITIMILWSIALSVYSVVLAMKNPIYLLYLGLHMIYIVFWFKMLERYYSKK